MDPFIEVPRIKWPKLRTIFRNSWPGNVVAFLLLDMQISHPNITNFFKVYSIGRDLSKGMVALSCQNGYLEIMIHPTNIDYIKEMEKALTETKIIDWSERFTIPSTNPFVQACVERVCKRLGIQIKVSSKYLKHVIDRTTFPFKTLSCPPGTYVDDLKPEYIDTINKTWDYFNDTSYEFFESLMHNKLTYVLYSTNDNLPLAWVTMAKSGVLRHLYCLEEYRRRGFGEFIIKFVVNDQLRKGKDILAYTLEGNEKPQRLFDKLGFRRIGSDTWIFINEN